MKKLIIFLAVTLLLGLPTVGSAAGFRAGHDAAQWQSECFGPTRNPQSLVCRVTRDIREEGSNRLLFKLGFVYPPQQKPVFKIKFALDLFLIGRLQLYIDDVLFREFLIDSCISEGCYLTPQDSSEFVDMMEAGAKVRIDYTILNSAANSVDVPMDNFGQTMSALRTSANP
ncbi:invasion associated locus B family protein [Stappia sp. BW2]|uniref:invasion associated locus B family protein n=1 Tax=Stappia sp. BW2 TaxID=2592622 RepID=UPI001396A17D|nr:invasion associated locus B family protein [Stappia sp. BW2]